MFLFANASLWSVWEPERGKQGATMCKPMCIRGSGFVPEPVPSSSISEASLKAFMELSMASVELKISENKGYPEKIDKQMNDEGFQGVHHVRTRSGLW